MDSPRRDHEPERISCPPTDDDRTCTRSSRRERRSMLEHSRIAQRIRYRSEASAKKRATRGVSEPSGIISVRRRGERVSFVARGTTWRSVRFRTLARARRRRSSRSSIAISKRDNASKKLSSPRASIPRSRPIILFPSTTTTRIHGSGLRHATASETLFQGEAIRCRCPSKRNLLPERWSVERTSVRVESHS